MSRICPKRKKPVIGLAGGIGAGKSSVARILASLGGAVIDSDSLTHEQYREPDVKAALRDWWGEAVIRPDGDVDRQAVGEIVFRDPGQLARLEALLYPRLAARREELIVACEADPDVLAIVLDAPKLYEAGLHEQCDTVIFVEADWVTRVERVAATRRWTAQDLQRRENLLIPLDRKRAIADHVVVNHSSMVALRTEVERVFALVRAAFTD